MPASDKTPLEVLTELDERASLRQLWGLCGRGYTDREFNSLVLAIEDLQAVRSVRYLEDLVKAGKADVDSIDLLCKRRREAREQIADLFGGTE